MITKCAITEAKTHIVRKPWIPLARPLDVERDHRSNCKAWGTPTRRNIPPRSSTICDGGPLWPLARPPGLGLCDRRSGDTWRGVRLYSVNYPFLAAFATRRSTTPTAETASAACSRQNPHPDGCPWGRIPSEVVASKGVGEDWLELSRKHLGIQDWDRIPKCLRFSSSQSSLAGSVLVRFFVGYCQLLL